MSKISVGNVFWNLRADGAELPKDVKRAILASKKQMERTGASFKSVGKKLTAGITAPITGLGFMSVKFAKDFQSVMLDVNKNVKGLNTENLKEYETKLLNIGARSMIGASGIARLASEGGKLGKSTGEAIEFAKAAEEIAIAFDFGRTVEGAEQAGQAVAQLESGFNITTGEVRDLADAINFFGDNTASNSKDITNIMGRQGATLANVSGLARNEIAALAATIDAAAPSPEIAATGMKNFVLALTEGSAASKDKSAALRDLGFDAVELAGRMQNDAKGGILDVVKALGGMDDAKRAATMMKLFGKESIGAIAPLIKNVGKLEKNMNLAGDASNFAGSIQGEVDRLKNSDAGKMALALAAINRAGIAIGTIILPVIGDLALKVTDVVLGLGDFATANPGLMQLGVVIAGVAAAVGPLLIGVGMMVSSMSGLIPIVTGLAGGAGGLAGVFGALVGVLTGPVALAIGGIIAGGALLMANWDSVKRFVGSMVSSISGAFSSWKSRNADTLAKIGEAWDGFKESAGVIFTAIGGWVSDLILSVDGLLAPIGGLQGAWELFADTITTVVGAAFDVLKLAFSEIEAVVTGQKSIWKSLGDVIGLAFKGLFNIGVKIGEKLVTVLSDSWEAVKEIDWSELGVWIVQGIMDGISSMKDAAWNAAAEFGQGIKDGIGDLFDFGSPSKVMKQFGRWIAEGLGIGIAQDTSAVKSASNMAANVQNAFKKGVAGAAVSVGVAGAAVSGDSLGGLAGQDEFSQDGFGSVASQYVPESDRIANKYAVERQLILNETKITEEQRQALLVASDKSRNKALAAGKQDLLGTLSGLQNSHDSKMQLLGKSAAVAQAVITKKGALHEAAMNTKAMAIGAYKALAPIPLIGPALGIAAAAAASAYGLSQVAGIKSQGAFAEGGDFVGNRAMLVGEEGPELVVPRSQGTVLTASQTAGLGRGSGGGVFVTQNFYDATPERLREMASEIEERAKAGVIEAVTQEGPERDAFRF